MVTKSAAKTAKRDGYHHGDLRRALLEAAQAEIAANGAQNVSLSSLARRAGVAQSAPYRHFADRDQLLAAVAAEGFASFTEALQAADAGPERGAIKRMAAAYLRFGEENVEIYRLMFASGLPAAGENSELRETALKSFRPLLDRVGSSRKARLTAQCIWAQLHGLVLLRADGYLVETIETLVAGIAAGQ